MYFESLDVLDNMILNVIKENARMSYSEIVAYCNFAMVSEDTEYREYILDFGEDVIQPQNR